MQSKLYVSRRNYRRLLLLNVFVCLVLFFATQKLMSGIQSGVQPDALVKESISVPSSNSWSNSNGQTAAFNANWIFSPVISGSDAVSRMFLLLIFLSCVFMTIDMIARHDSGFMSPKIFLLILVPYLQLVFFASNIKSDIYTLFLVTLFLYVVLHPYRSALRIPILIIVSLLLFFIQPLLLLFPLIITMVHFSLRHRDLPFTREAIMLVIYMLTILPVGISGLKSSRTFPTSQRTLGIVPVKAREKVSTLAIRLFQYNPSVLCV